MSVKPRGSFTHRCFRSFSLRVATTHLLTILTVLALMILYQGFCPIFPWLPIGTSQPKPLPRPVHDSETEANSAV